VKDVGVSAAVREGAARQRRAAIALPRRTVARLARLIVEAPTRDGCRRIVREWIANCISLEQRQRDYRNDETHRLLVLEQANDRIEALTCAGQEHDRCEQDEYRTHRA
jgi:hypothetical protein